jgi:hypothetical protein
MKAANLETGKFAETVEDAAESIPQDTENIYQEVKGDADEMVKEIGETMGSVTDL